MSSRVWLSTKLLDIVTTSRGLQSCQCRNSPQCPSFHSDSTPVSSHYRAHFLLAGLSDPSNTSGSSLTHLEGQPRRYFVCVTRVCASSRSSVAADSTIRSPVHWSNIRNAFISLHFGRISGVVKHPLKVSTLTSLPQVTSTVALYTSPPFPLRRCIKTSCA